MFEYSDVFGFSLLSVFTPLSLKGLFTIAPGSARGLGFPKRKSAARTGGCENLIGFAAQYLKSEKIQRKYMETIA